MGRLGEVEDGVFISLWQQRWYTVADEVAQIPWRMNSESLLALSGQFL